MTANATPYYTSAHRGSLVLSLSDLRVRLRVNERMIARAGNIIAKPVEHEIPPVIGA
jgi:hypothetical protein